MLLLVGLVLVVLVLAASVAAAWTVSDRFLIPQPYALMPEFVIGSVELIPARADADTAEYEVELPLRAEYGQFADVRREGTYNLLWEDGYGRLGPILSEGDNRVIRRVSSVVGEPPMRGRPARLDTTVFRRDPLRDHGIAFDELELSGESGKLYAWWVDTGDGRAVLALHGRRRADRTETLRVLPTLVDAGWSTLALAYRNHDRSDPSPDGLFHYGASEVDDVVVALADLAHRGVTEVVLYGFSMGGAVALEAVHRWPVEAPRLVGLILDSPLLDPRTVLRKGVRDAGMPFPDRVTDLALAIAGLRTGVAWERLDQRSRAGALRVPLLLIAGSADSTIPIGLVDEFAANVSAPMEYLRLDGVEHVEGWNSSRVRYEGAVAEFLDGL